MVVALLGDAAGGNNRPWLSGVIVDALKGAIWGLAILFVNVRSTPY